VPTCGLAAYRAARPRVCWVAATAGSRVSKGKSFTVAELVAAGVKRISLATSLYRAAMTGLLKAAKEVREHGTFGYIDTSLAAPEMNAFLRE
jgi:2-methylisocitrate lyase-like PEP mutase family enzyme